MKSRLSFVFEGAMQPRILFGRNPTTLTHPLRAYLALALAAASLLSLPLAVSAQHPSTPANPDLTATQKAQMQARQERMQKDVTALRTDTKLTPAQKEAKFRVLAAATEKDMMAILTPPQRALLLKQRQINVQFKNEVEALRADKTLTDKQKQARFEALMSSRQAALLATLPPSLRTKVEKEHQAELGRVAEANRIGEELQKSLSKKTQEQIHQITLETRAKMQAVAQDATLSPAVKAARLHSLGQEAESKIDVYLTPQQRAEFAKYHELISPATPH